MKLFIIVKTSVCRAPCKALCTCPLIQCSGKLCDVCPILLTLLFIEVEELKSFAQVIKENCKNFVSIQT